jgi:hypothetical protein
VDGSGMTNRGAGNRKKPTASFKIQDESLAEIFFW